MANTEYEMIPHQLLSDLKYDVEALKKKLQQPDTKIQELLLEIESLKDAVHELTGIFHKTLEEIKEEGDTTKTFSAVKDKLETVVSQNETIAKGMIAISDKLEGWMTNQSPINMAQKAAPPPMSKGAEVGHIMGPPSMPGPGRVAPRPQDAPAMPPSINGDDMDFPPPPPSATSKKKGIFKL